MVETGLFRGQYRDNKILKLQRHFDRIEVVQPNTRFYFDPESPLSRASEANAPDAVLAVMDVVAQDVADAGAGAEPSAVLVDFTPVLLSENLVQIKPAKRPDAPPGKTLTLGKFSGERSKIVRLASYPDNALVNTDLVYEVAAPVVSGGDDVTDARAITASVQHSFIKLPGAGYEPRLDDYRVGFFTDRITDMTSRDPAPYRDLINRWHLVKKNPEMTVSDPVEPIVWWLENTTPLEFRDMITRAALAGTVRSKRLVSVTPSWSSNNQTTQTGMPAIFVTTCCAGRHRRPHHSVVTDHLFPILAPGKSSAPTSCWNLRF